MQDIKGLIQREGAEIARLHAKIHETFKERNTKLNEWKVACKDFHSYVSPIDQYVDGVYKENNYSNPDLLEFAISFLEVDPLFHRSGYIKEELLRKLKRTELSPRQNERLNVVLMDAVDKRNSREFKAYCRLAAIIATPKLIRSIETVAAYGEGSRKSRANLMLNYIRHDSVNT